MSLLVVALSCGTGFANGALSRAHTVDVAEPTVRGAAGPIAQTTFDFTVSYWDVVSDDVWLGAMFGEDDAKFMDEKVNRDNRARQIEEAIRYWSDVLYEASNGAHRLGRVTIYQAGKFVEASNIRWRESGRADATLNGYRRAGQMAGDTTSKINLYDKEQGYVFIGILPTTDSKENNARLGYVLAHESGHFIYGVQDEYAEEGKRTIPPAGNTLMKSHESVPISANSWAPLNFSTPLNYLGVGVNTNQMSYYGRSVWETLVLPPNGTGDVNTDDGTKAIAHFPRAVYTFNEVPDTVWDALPGGSPDDLAGAPESDYIITNSGKPADYAHNAKAQSDLEITWIPVMAPTIYQIVIDHSGSMAGDNYDDEPLDKAKSAARSFLGKLNMGSYVGVVAFSSSPSQIYPITQITEENIAVEFPKIRAAINGLTSGGGTAIYDSALDALDNMNTAFAGISKEYAGLPDYAMSGTTVLITDGDDTSSSRTPADVTRAYNAARVPLMIIGFGTGINAQKPLQDLSNSTGGSFFASPTDNVALSKAITAAASVVSEIEFVGEEYANVPAGGSASVTFTLDNTLADATFNISYPGTETDITTVVTGGGKTETASGYDDSGFAEQSASFTAPAAGTYTVKYTNTTAGALEVYCALYGTPDSSVGSYHLALSNARTEEPQEVNTKGKEKLYAVVTKDGELLTGIDSISGAIYDEKGTKVSDVLFRDDGNLTTGDSQALDGFYSAYVTFPSGGTYTVQASVSASGAQVRTTALSRADVSESTALGTPFSATFSRSASLTLVANSSLDPSPETARHYTGSGPSDDTPPSTGGGGGGCSTGAFGLAALALAALVVARKK
jgi:uncharacterized protein YegL